MPVKKPVKTKAPESFRTSVTFPAEIYGTLEKLPD